MPLPFAGNVPDPLDEHTLAAVALGVSTRRYASTLDPVPAEVNERATSSSAVSRRFVALSTKRLQAFLARPLGELDLRVVCIDGKVFRGHCMVIALGIDTQGRKHVLGRAITDVFGSRGVVQRCQVHKCRNVLGHLPERLHASVSEALRDAWNLDSADRAARVLERLAGSLERDHPGAAASIREGLEETPTVQRLAVTGALQRTLRRTNIIENLNGSVERYQRACKSHLPERTPRPWTRAGASVVHGAGAPVPIRLLAHVKQAERFEAGHLDSVAP